MTHVLPPHPSLEFDRKQAKALLDAARGGDPQAIRRFVEMHPDFASEANPAERAQKVQLHDAQLVIAREYGFPSWRALAEKIGEIELAEFQHKVRAGDVEGTRRRLKCSPDLVKKINDPMFDFGGRPINQASSNPALVDVLLEFGADINLRSEWDKGPYSILDNCSEEAARHYLKRGAKLTAHAAARIGWIGELRAILDADPNVVHERGGDGQQPLHFAKTTAIADLLLDRGADIDARCIDHHSTPAQYALADRPEICRHLLSRGATPDIFMPARLGDTQLADRLIDQDPSCLSARINSAGYAPVPPFNTYCWSLGWFLSPHEVALKFNQPALYELLWTRSPQKVKFMVACARGDTESAQQMLHERPDLPRQLSSHEQALLPYSMFHGQVDSVKRLLSLGFDPMATGVDGGTLLHVAAWHGNAEIVRLLLEKFRDRLDVNAVETTHHATPLGWTAHGSQNSFLRAGGNYPAVARILVDAGAKLNRSGPPTAAQKATDEQIQKLLAQAR
jgi:ankyrin repeat protein